MMKLNAITIGDPAGIGPEISIKGLMKNDTYRNNTLIIGSQSILEYYSKKLENPYPLNIIESPEEFLPNQINIINAVDLSLSEFEIGTVSSKAGDAAYRYLEKAIDLAMEDRIGAIITGPLNKEALHKGGHYYDGHTEIFAELTGTSKYTMMLWSNLMAVVHVSTHVSLREACDRVKKDRVYDCIQLAQEAMINMGIESPKIAVAGLNPHSGESGLFGTEDRDEIAPAIEQSVKEGLNVSGPLPPDTVFLQASKGKYDVVVAMYHDQGHIPMKLLAFDSGVNVTLGLPIIRTSVDHGTAFDIAGKGLANEESILAALDVSTRLI
ncbi:4-hydroxythreonine-4-phosphate dehydrogenase [Marinilactibacillus piezotolerans]|uniref:4-hydroxythreonine-4-phosphate dehydrogenase n=1 Tax=Marinilactibacillus piezotolerans TaxID=258723 RepID=A0A1I4C1E2_9LACT|nr:4-hydroxythreonine-4-phosphate dehydrogenase PdxA [Marinilactibacillus piezotolerans]SFK74872.1 4-hydroxythreonine-4-phosphate dehydrogenase [Marinilactibacillus piezotolerans]